MSSPTKHRVPGPCAIVVSRYNTSVTSTMLDGAVDAYLARNPDPDALAILEAPGAYELTAIAAAAAGSEMYEAVVCLGCIIKGETEHDRHIAAAVARGLSEITLATGVPVAFGVLTTNTNEQARARAGGEKGNKGTEAMNAALDAADAIAALAKGYADNRPGVRFTPGLKVNDKLNSAARNTK